MYNHSIATLKFNIANSISRSEAMESLAHMDSSKAIGHFSLSDGRSYELIDGQAKRTNKGGALQNITEGAKKAVHGNNPFSSDAKLFTQALKTEINSAVKMADPFVAAWNSDSFTNAKDVAAELGTRGHQSKTDYQFLVHTAPVEHLIQGKGVFAKDAEASIAKWDVLCTTIVNQDKTFTYGSMGILLKAPGENVLAASPDDLMSETNVGRIDRADYLVNSDHNTTKSRYASMESHERTGLLKKELDRHARHQNTPQQVLDRTYGLRNEILLATPSGVNIREGEKATGKLEIAGFFLNDCEPSYDAQSLAEFKGEKLLSKDEKYELFKQHAEPLAQALGVSVLYFNGQADCGESAPK